MRLNLGSGPRAVPGWVNIDRSPNVLLDRVPAAKRVLRRVGLLNAQHMAPWDRDVQRADIRELPYPNGSVDAIYSSHTLEHLYLADAQRVIDECARTLRPGAILRLALPDGEQIAREFIARADAGDPDAGWLYNSASLAHPVERPTGKRLLMAATAGHIHHWQPTSSMVRTMMEKAGFRRIVQCDYREGRLPDLATIETRPESFFLEGEAP
jgi:predicted SAM-dependent methyltransferase